MNVALAWRGTDRDGLHKKVVASGLVHVKGILEEAGIIKFEVPPGKAWRECNK
jgi:hypothetical protein